MWFVYGLIGFLLFPGMIWSVCVIQDAYYEWRNKHKYYKKCPLCGTYVLNFMRKAYKVTPNDR